MWMKGLGIGRRGRGWSCIIDGLRMGGFDAGGAVYISCMNRKGRCDIMYSYFDTYKVFLMKNRSLLWL